jgi:hypothetical protein
MSTTLDFLKNLPPATKDSSAEESGDLNCQICLEPYDTDAHAPVFARRCRHSVCRKCIVDMGAQWFPTQTITPSSGSQRRPGVPFVFQSNAPPSAAAASWGQQPTTTFSGVGEETFQETGIACPTCRKGKSFQVNQEPNFLAICLLKENEQIKKARSRRLLRGNSFKSNHVYLKLREKNLIASSKGSRFDEMDLLKEKIRALEAENVGLLAENSELHAGELAKETITDMLLVEKEKLLKAVQSKLKLTQKELLIKKTTECNAMMKYKVTIERKDFTIADINQSLEKAKAKAHCDREHAKKTQKALFAALFVLVLFSFISILFALMAPQPHCPTNIKE